MFEETDFQIAGREPKRWLESAQRLKDAADAVGNRIPNTMEGFRKVPRREMFIVFPYLMLAGMATENLLKGVIVARKPGLIEADRLNTREWSGGEHAHDLRHLARVAEIDVNPDEEEMLVRMSEAVLWNGRYPIPKNGIRLEAKVTRGGRKFSRRTYVLTDPETFEQLFARLSQMLH